MSWNNAPYESPYWATHFRLVGTLEVKVTDDGASRDEFVEYRSYAEGVEVPSGWHELMNRFRPLGETGDLDAE